MVPAVYDNTGQSQDPNSLLTCHAFFPQEQGLKANNSKELSMCFTEVSRGMVGGWVLEAGPQELLFM